MNNNIIAPYVAKAGYQVDGMNGKGNPYIRSGDLVLVDGVKGYVTNVEDNGSSDPHIQIMVKVLGSQESELELRTFTLLKSEIVLYIINRVEDMSSSIVRDLRYQEVMLASQVLNCQNMLLRAVMVSTLLAIQQALTNRGARLTVNTSSL